MTNEPHPPGDLSASTPALHPPSPPSSPSSVPETHVETPGRKLCPACAAAMPAEAFVCRVCRFNARTGSFVDARPRTNGLAVASLTMGLVALMIFPLIPLSALGGLLALVMGGAATRQIKKSEGAMSGAEMARFGLLLGLLAVLIALGLSIVAYVLDIEVLNVDLST